MALRLRYEIDSPRRVREHLHFVDGAGYFFFPGVTAAKGTLAVLEIDFTQTDQSAHLRGTVWTNPSGGGIWLELLEAERCLEKLETTPRGARRIATDQLVLAEAAGFAAVLCRLRDVSAGGARLRLEANDAGPNGSRIRLVLPEAGPTGLQLEACGHLVWTRGGEAGIEWRRGDLSSRAAVLRLVQLADEEWEGARTLAHPPTCRCMKDQKPPPVLLLG
ncbi:MAG: PilZ domain-containing protein [Myxococcales bacterium]|nr:PilZ domain-containing protein [Myxococcales bacterium]